MRALSFATYRVIAYFHALAPKEGYSSYMRHFGLNDFKYRKIVLENLYYDHKWNRPLRQLLYIVSPRLSKKLGVNI